MRLHPKGDRAISEKGTPNPFDALIPSTREVDVDRVEDLLSIFGEEGEVALQLVRAGNKQATLFSLLDKLERVNFNRARAIKALLEGKSEKEIQEWLR